MSRRCQQRVPIEGLGLARHPTRPVIYGRGEASSRSIIELDVRYGTLRYGDGIHIWHWGIATAGPLGQVCSRTPSPISSSRSTIGRSKVKAVTPILRMPRPVTYLPTAGLAAVGAYMSRRISFLAEPGRHVDQVATLPTCQKVHALIFDEPSAYLYFWLLQRLSGSDSARSVVRTWRRAKRRRTRRAGRPGRVAAWA
ncbi:MAG: hypothetical protein U0610_31130 [bacterium]